ncbi:response regulator transcription factor [Breznakiella homolactica]|uniref:Response regulator transcription factor n=1 Tax=Breznakiella homolactica TaxID=2798577 RepID=A0A7T7XLU7_9SPIR|nr:response regulator transcription factor [Breznakiella homolactica]QQO08681.1 response regulator transcription factor [Breznakiella homolactica]
MKRKILLIEPGDAIRNLIAELSIEENLEILRAATIAEALNFLSHSPEIIVIDLEYYSSEACQFIAAYRKTGTALLLMYLSHFDEKLVISGFDSGADNYILGNHPPKISFARIRAAIRREYGMRLHSTDDVINFGPFSLDLNTESLRKNGEKMHISERNINILLYLGKNAGRPVSPEEIYTHVLRKEHGGLTIIGVYIQRLRKIIEINPEIPNYIQTVHGLGYMLNAAPSREMRFPFNLEISNTKKDIYDRELEPSMPSAKTI